MKFLVVLLVALTISFAYARPGGHGWAPAPAPVSSARTYHIIREVVQAPHVHEPPVSVKHRNSK